MTILERLGRGLIRAVVTPIMIVDEFLSPNDEVAIAREARAKAEGERDEARRVCSEEREYADGWRRAAEHDADRCRELEREIETLRSELDSAATDDEQYHHTAATLQDRTRERDALLNASANHAAEVNALRARIRELEEQADRNADLTAQVTQERDAARNEAKALRATNETLAARLTASTAVDEKPAADKCAWCLGAIGDSKEWLYGSVASAASGDAHDALHVCAPCADSDDVDGVSVRARVALRASSCPSRQVADPLSIGCDDCEAWPGTPCRPKVAISGDSQ